jgi:hypothetical protein
VTKAAGVVTSAFGLAVMAADMNGDGWLDLYVSNDYIEPDFIFINNHDGTFTDHYKDYLKHSSQASMGNDIEDINNDGLVDIMVLDMKPGDPIRYKMLMNNMLYDRYQLLVQYGYGRQVGRNVLQLNNGNQTFSDIGQYAGVATTDWSWGVLMADYDNDGWKDIFVSNGYRKDVTQFDYLNYFRDSVKRTGELTPQRFRISMISSNSCRKLKWRVTFLSMIRTCNSMMLPNKPAWTSSSTLMDVLMQTLMLMVILI